MHNQNARKINLLNEHNERVCSLETGGLSEDDLANLMDDSFPMFNAQKGALAYGELILRGRIDLVGSFLEQNKSRNQDVIGAVMKNIWEYFISPENKASLKKRYPDEVEIIEEIIATSSKESDISIGISIST